MAIMVLLSRIVPTNSLVKISLIFFQLILNSLLDLLIQKIFLLNR